MGEADKLDAASSAALLAVLRERFEKNTGRHEGIDWEPVRKRLEAKPEKLRSLAEMESSGGEPDLVAYDERADEYVFYDCSAETPKGRRNLCYDRAGLESRKAFAPDRSAVEAAAEIGVDLLDESEYRFLQTLGEFDLKTSSWLKTPQDVRSRGGALFGDRRYGRVFIYHNGAQSYYSVRGFRGSLRA